MDLEKQVEEFVKQVQEKYGEEFRKKADELNSLNKERDRLCRKRYYETHRDWIHEIGKAYRFTERGCEVARRSSKKRYENLKKSRQGLTSIDRKEIREFYRNRPQGFHVDHIIPIGKGGRHHISNLQYLTAEQNWEKGKN